MEVLVQVDLDTELALKWWGRLPEVMKNHYSIAYCCKYVANITPVEIHEIWQKESVRYTHTNIVTF